ncbi:relaxase/mobilization nuclease domain-containing protein [Limnobacter sp.]|uniref:relaxase/mobilization nuclease domain-containing protein n=1 Tax=Limnobacter sp. TaxID=2003368 RepID=UPI0027BAED53|nr:LPD7 domain-containing protein [Limnobacter sp.]
MSTGVIGKYVAGGSLSKSKQKRIKALTFYVCDFPEPCFDTGLDKQHTADEKHLFSSQSTHFLCKPFVGLKKANSKEAWVEMWASSEHIKKSKNTVEHFVFSFGSRVLTQDQYDVACNVIADTLGVKNCLWVAGAHQNTKNFHIHFVVNRVTQHLEQPQCIRINKGYHQDAAHMVSARLCHEFGIEPSPNAMFVYDPSLTNDNNLKGLRGSKFHLSENYQPSREMQHGSELSVESIHKSPRDKSPINPSAAAYEKRTGMQSVQRLAQELIPELRRLIANKAGWMHFENALHARGWEFKLSANGRGGVLLFGDEAIKLSAVSYHLRYSQLVAAFGPYSGLQSTIAVAQPTHNVPLVPSVMQQDFIQLTTRKKSERSKLNKYISEKQDAIERRYKQKATEPVVKHIIVEAPLGHEVDSRSVFREQFTKEQAELRTHRKKQLKRFNDHWKQISLADLENFEWSSRFKFDTFAPLKQKYVVPIVSQVSLLYEAKKFGTRVVYQSVETKQIAFVDTGDMIQMNIVDDNSVEAALLLALEKWGNQGFAISGSDYFKQKCVSTCLKLGVRPSNPDLCEIIDTLSAAEQKSKTEISKSATTDPVIVAAFGSGYTINKIELRFFLPDEISILQDLLRSIGAKYSEFELVQLDKSVNVIFSSTLCQDQIERHLERLLPDRFHVMESLLKNRNHVYKFFFEAKNAGVFGGSDCISANVDDGLEKTGVLNIDKKSRLSLLNYLSARGEDISVYAKLFEELLASGMVRCIDSFGKPFNPFEPEAVVRKPDVTFSPGF